MSYAAPSASLHRDLISAYAASGARIASWAIVSAVVYRTQGAEPFAILAIIRSTLSFLNFSTLGLAPALVRMLAIAKQSNTADLTEISASPRRSTASDDQVLRYAMPERPSDLTPDVRTGRVYASSESLALCLGVIALIPVCFYARYVKDVHHLSPLQEQWHATSLAAFLGIGIVVRLVSEPSAGLLQVSGRIWLDNAIQTAADITWCLSILILKPELNVVGLTYLLCSIGVFVARRVCVKRSTGIPFLHFWRPDWSVMSALMSGGLLITLSQLADFLYAPIDFILISRLLDPRYAATYAPAVQVDAALLVLVTGLAATLLPRAAVAHAGGDVLTVRRYYVRGTLASLAMLAAAAIVVWATSPWLFRLWLGDHLPATQAILPLILIHTVVGGSSAVGRSILLGMGKVKPYAIAALTAGVLNVVLSYCFVKFLGLGLNGIVYGTIVAVVLRCAVWQPWYVMRSLRVSEARPQAIP